MLRRGAIITVVALVVVFGLWIVEQYFPTGKGADVLWAKSLICFLGMAAFLLLDGCLPGRHRQPRWEDVLK